jgi:hypothetical protein
MRTIEREQLRIGYVISYSFPNTSKVFYGTIVQTVFFATETKIYLAEMKPLPKPASRPISNDRAARSSRVIVLKEGEAKPTLLHPTRVSPPRPIFSPGGVPLLLFRLFLPQLACWQWRLILAAISRRITLPRRAW